MPAGNRKPIRARSRERSVVVLNPESVFKSPAALLAAPEFSVGEKLEALENWALDVNQRLVADSEGMPRTDRSDDDAELLRDIGKAQQALAEDLKHR